MRIHDYSADEIWEMKAGREMDAAIAVSFFDWRWMQYQAPNYYEPKQLTLLCPPEAPDRICVPNQYDRIWSPSDRHAPRFSEWDQSVWWENYEYQRGFPAYSADMGDAWLIIGVFRDMWSQATDGVSGLNDEFARPFDDGYFFERLHRFADRRWPWALLYLTPEAICKAALLQCVRNDDDE